MTSIIPSVFPIDNKLALSLPFVDWLSFTIPAADIEPFALFLDSQFAIFGATRTDDGLYRFGTPDGFGTCKIDQVKEVYVISISGTAYRYLVLMQVRDDLLHAISELPHKITRLDVACDFDVPAHIAIKQLSDNAYTGNVRLTRKTITQKQIKEILSYDLDGNKTGTLYLGHRASSDVCCRVYDKAHEVNQKTNMHITPRLRIEFTFKGLTLPTLRDVSLPSDIFYHHASHSLVKPPETFKTWESHGTGFYVEKKAPKTAYAKIRGLLEFSTDVQKLCAYSVEEFGYSAPQELAKLFKERVKKTIRGMGGPHAGQLTFDFK